MPSNKLYNFLPHNPCLCNLATNKFNACLLKDSIHKTIFQLLYLSISLKNIIHDFPLKLIELNYNSNFTKNYHYVFSDVSFSNKILFNNIL